MSSRLDRTLRIARFGDHDLPVPAAESDGAAGLDIRTNEDIVLWPNEELLVGTGFAYEPPLGHALFLLPRSGLGATHGIILGNTVGLIDTDYRGELKVALWYRRSEGKPFTASRGERIAQLVCLPILPPSFALEVDYSMLSTTARGQGGFGSSGQK